MIIFDFRNNVSILIKNAFNIGYDHITKKRTSNYSKRPIGITSPKSGGVQNLADKIGMTARTRRFWARNDRNPNGPARLLLKNMGLSYGIPLEE